MIDDFTEILQCPSTGHALSWASKTELVSTEGGPAYRFLDGVACLLPRKNDGQVAGGRNVSAFYEREGWAQDEQGLFGDTKVFLDTRATSLNFTRKCITRLNKYFAKGGQYLLDAGSGPIAHDELLTYDTHFDRRVCVDLSVSALRAARSKIGDRGIYIQGDLTNLPIKTGSMDAVTCNHVIYQIPAESQAIVFQELWRVLKPGGIGVVVYWWPHAPLAWRIERMARLFAGKPVEAETETQPAAEPLPELSHHPQTRSWFESQNWPFRYRFDSFRVISNVFMRQYVSDDWRGRAFLNALYAFQEFAPGYCGKHGFMPAIIIYKD